MPRCCVRDLFWLILLLAAAGRSLRAQDPGRAAPKPVDATTLQRKVLCGYQGWFRCPNDGTREGWLHWSRNRRELTPSTVTFEMWPDTAELADDEKYPVPGFTTKDQPPAYLFSSAHPKTVERHFQWMQQYGIDGVFVQRFLVNLKKPSFDTVLERVRTSAAKTGRVFAIGYDLSGAPADKLVELLARDWQRLVDQAKVTSDERYQRHREKPVVFVWGFFSDRFSAEVAHRLIDIFHGDDRYAATLIGGCHWDWRREKDADWARAYRRFDVLSPWNVGNYHEEQGKKQAATASWPDDLKETQRAGQDYLPVLYPGFGWTNLQGRDAEKQTIPRLGGEFYWRQFARASKLGLEMAYVAMFDEVDEATAIFKVTNDPPTQAPFTTYDGLPSDWYLRLTGEGTRLIRGERRFSMELPIKP